MRRALLLVVGCAPLLAAAQGQTPQTEPRKGTGLLLGRVVEGQTTEPVPGALVALNGAGATAQKVVTNASGQFLFSELPDGSFMLSVTKPGYLPGGTIGGPGPSGSPRPLELASGERRGDLTIHLRKYATIAGVVRDESGAGTAGLGVSLVPRVQMDGRPVFAAGPYAEVPTDDRGAYRFNTVAPGEYVVFARSPGDVAERALMTIGLTDQSVLMSMAPRIASGGIEGLVDVDPSLRVVPPTFHPATATPDEAAVLRIRAGDERSDVDIQVRSERTGRVGGTLLHDGAPIASARLRLLIGGEGSEIEVASANSGREGRFVLSGVPAGRYSLSAMQVPRTSAGRGGRGRGAAPDARPTLPADPTLWLARTVVVGDAESANMTLALQTGPRIRGRVEFSGNSPRPAAEQLTQIALTVVRAGPGDSQTANLIGVVEPDGTFSTMGIPPGAYRLRALAGGRWRAASAMSGGVDLLDTPAVVGAADIEGVVLTLVDTDGATISGTIRDARGAADAEAVVVLLPVDQRLISDRRMRVVRTSRTGQYTIALLPAGEYAIALSSEERVELGLDRDEIARLVQGGVRVTVADGDRKIVDLRGGRP